MRDTLSDGEVQPEGQADIIRPEVDWILAGVPDFLCLKDADGRWQKAEPRYADLFGLAGVDYFGKTNMELAESPDANPEALRVAAEWDAQAWSFGRPLRNAQAAESLAYGEAGFDITRTPMFDNDGRNYRLLITGVPLARKIAEEPGIYAAIFNSCKMPFLLLDADLKVLNANLAYTVFTGYSKRDSLGKQFVFLGEHTPAQAFALTVSAFLRTNPALLWSGEIVCHCKNADSYPARLHISAIESRKGEPTSSYLAYFFDISKEKEHEQRIMQIAHYDELTGLPNRALFFEQLTKALAQGARHKSHAALLFVNIDRFKAVNDSLGRHAGDALLIEVAHRLSALLKNPDVVARLGGDEFAIMHQNEKTHEKAIYATSIIAQDIVSNLAKFFFIEQQELYISLSVGIAIYPEDADKAETLVKHAELAMLEAKKQGNNSFHYFQEKYTSKAKDRHLLEVSLRRALEKQELQLYYQPQYTADTRKLHGAEVLIRWLKGKTKLLSPYYFIDIAEETGLIIPIGKWILETACEQQKAWMDAGYAMHHVSVNVSARQFMYPHFVETVEEALAKTGLDPMSLELEITESMLIGDAKKIELQLNRFKKMGIAIALDDFGTGYSSLAYLKNFPIDVVKIDQSFVRGMTPGSKDARIVCAIIDMGHSLGYKVIAEGVESEEQLVFLSEKGCDIIQGYFFSKPLPTADMDNLLARTVG
ncbi:MAG: putative bifunctional diguanylate cyclase/phosphodiesterase [Candidatus Methylumidiphilus sp.]